MPTELRNLIHETAEKHRSAQACIAGGCRWRRLFDIHSQHLTDEILRTTEAYWVSKDLPDGSA